MLSNISDYNNVSDISKSNVKHDNNYNNVSDINNSNFK